MSQGSETVSAMGRIPSAISPSKYLTEEVLKTNDVEVEGFTMTDAFYGNIYIDSKVHPLLGTDHPDISSTIAWAHTYENSKIVYLMPGFTKEAYGNESYQRLISNALNFVAGST